MIRDLQSISGVLKVQAGNSPQDWILDTQESDDVVERVASQVIQKGYGLLEITSARADLEDIFLKLTYGSSEVQA